MFRVCHSPPLLPLPPLSLPLPSPSPPKTQVKDSQFVMLLCRWAITPHREGQHRPLVAAQLMKQRQNTVLKVCGVKEEWLWEGVWGVGEGV